MYQSKLAVRDAPVLSDLRERAGQSALRLSAMQIFLARKGHGMSIDRAQRLWRLADLQVATPNQVWAYEFVFDACANEQTLKCLTVVDEYTGEALAIDVAGRIRRPASSRYSPGS